MAIPTSNKPDSKGGKSAKNAADEKAKKEQAAKAFQAKVKEAIRITKEELEVTEKEAVKVEDLKMNTLWSTGERLVNLAEGLNSRENAILIGQFHKETGMSESFFYLAKQSATSFTKEQYNQLKVAKATVRVVKALVTLKDDKLRAKAIKGVIDDGWDENRIRQISGTKGSRKGSASKQTRDNDKKRPPIRVFTKGVDQALNLSVTMGSCADAVSRLAQCKTDKDRVDATKVLMDLRKQLKKAVDEASSFIKYTDSFEKKTAKKK